MKLLLNINAIQKFMIKGFVFLGPIGAIIPDFTGINGARFYYFLLPVGIILFLWKRVNHIAIIRLLILSPILFYMLFSASISQLIFDSTIKSLNFNPLFRSLLLLTFIVFSIFAGTIAAKYNYKAKVNLIILYVSGYIVSLISGYILYIGYYINIFSLDFITKFHVSLQFGYGLLRFSPGSYPNEYGIMSSFILSLITFLIIKHKELISAKNKFIKILFLIPLFIFTFLALFLATTRAAYIAYILSVIYLSYEAGNIKGFLKWLFYIAIIILFTLFICQIYVVDIISVLKIGFTGVFNNEDTNVNSRFYEWQNIYAYFSDSPFLGIGFGTTPIHNTYLQLLFELGILGIIVLLICIIIFVLYEKNKKKTCTCKYCKVVLHIAILHVLWFSMSNHNLNHHLTWFCLFLYLMLQEDLMHNSNNNMMKNKD